MPMHPTQPSPTGCAPSATHAHNIVFFMFSPRLGLRSKPPAFPPEAAGGRRGTGDGTPSPLGGTARCTCRNTIPVWPASAAHGMQLSGQTGRSMGQPGAFPLTRAKPALRRSCFGQTVAGLAFDIAMCTCAWAGHTGRRGRADLLNWVGLAFKKEAVLVFGGGAPRRRLHGASRVCLSVCLSVCMSVCLSVCLLCDLGCPPGCG